MEMAQHSDERSAFSIRTAELAVAGFFFLLGAIVIFDSVRLGAKWAADGPQTGYFPFYLGCLICAASAINFLVALRAHASRNSSFVRRGQLKLVLSVLIPSAIFTGMIGWLGIYVSAALYVSFFMRWLGRYAWWKLAAVAFGNSAFFYVIFEVWFKIPLVKGPIEALLGLD
jgi:putative tricarboxylic transport membrane protein